MKINLILILIMLGYGCSFNAQQVWTQKKGDAYFQIGSSLLSYSSLHNYTNSAIAIPRPITELILSSYSEYGITDNLTVAANVPYHIITSGNLVSEWNSFAPEKGNLAALGNVSLGLTYKMYQKKALVISSKVTVGLKSAKFDQAKGLRTGFDAFGISPLILAGVGKSNYFASAEMGLKLMTTGYLNRFVLNAQIGKKFLKSKRLLFIFSVSTSSALGNSSAINLVKLDGNAKYTGLYLNDQSYYAVNLKLGFNFYKDWTIWSALSGGMANNVGRNAVYSLSIAYKLKKKTT